MNEGCSMFRIANLKIAGFLALLAGLSTNAFTKVNASDDVEVLDDFTVVKTITDDAKGAVISYLKDDPTCHSCRGNARSAGVTYLEKVRNNSTQDIYLRGKVWSNSCQDWGNGIHIYGSPNASPGQCGYTEVRFFLPISKNADVWTANFSHITTDIDDQTPVQQVIPVIAPANPIQSALLGLVKLDWRYPPLQIDIEQIFNHCTPYLE